MSLLCDKRLTPLQRRSMQQMGGILTLTVLTNLVTPNLPNPLLDIFPGLARFIAIHEHASVSFAGLLALFSVLPVLLAVWVVAHYLMAEPDEFIRALVVQALLWGFAVTMAGNAVASAFINLYARPFPLTVLCGDLFFASSLIAFRLLQRSYREELPANPSR
jgi:hypothetical protein